MYNELLLLVRLENFQIGTGGVIRGARREAVYFFAAVQ